MDSEIVESSKELRIQLFLLDLAGKYSLKIFSKSPQLFFNHVLDIFVQRKLIFNQEVMKGIKTLGLIAIETSFPKIKFFNE